MAVSVKTQTEYTQIESKRFLCARCLHFMIEWTPVIKKGMMAGFKRHVAEDCSGKVPQVWLQCPNGHPFGVHGARDIMDRAGRVVRRQPGQGRVVPRPRPKPIWKPR